MHWEQMSSPPGNNCFFGTQKTDKLILKKKDPKLVSHTSCADWLTSSMNCTVQFVLLGNFYNIFKNDKIALQLLFLIIWINYKEKFQCNK